MTRAPRAAAGLAGVFLLTLASTDPVDLAIGLAVGLAVALALGDRLRPRTGADVPPLAGRVVWLPVYAAAVLADVVAGTWDVALRVLHLRPVDAPGFVRVPIGERSERGVAVSALTTTLSPGSVLVDVDWGRRELLLHVIDASDPDAIRADLQRHYDRYQRRVFP